MASIRQLIIAAFVTSIFFAFAFLGVGSFAASNHITVPNGLKSQYNAYSGGTGTNLSNTISPLSQKAAAYQNSTTQNSWVASITSTSGLLTTIYGAITGVWTAYASTIGTALSLLGINTTYTQGIAVLIVIIIVVLSILSAISLFPI